MTTLEDRVRHALHDMADDVQPAHLLSRLDRHEGRIRRTHTRRRLAAVVAAVVAAVGIGSVLLLPIDQPNIIEPVKNPPKVFRLSDTTSVAPGRALLAVTLARPNPAVADGEHEDPLYVLPLTRGAAVHLPGSDRVPYSWSSELSADGTRLIRSNESYVDPHLEVVELATGRSDDLGDRKAYCPQLSSDNGTVVAYGPSGVQVFDVGTGSSRSLYRVKVTQDFPCGGLGWSPDGRRLVVRTDSGSVVIDRLGTVQLRLPDSYAVNSSMSWAPDGRRLLLYDRLHGEYEVVRPDAGSTLAMRWPTDALRPLGWAGHRVVWLAGAPGDYRLVTTDQRGRDVKTWMRFDIGDKPIEAVSWSQDLSGTAAP